MKRSIQKFAVLTGMLLALFLMILPTAGASADVRGGCNEETATALGEEYDLNPFAPSVTKMSPLCGEFLGPGVEAMVARAIPATCGGYAGWAVLRHEPGDSWQLVFKERDGAQNLTAVGNDLEETDNILVYGDARCTGKKNTKTRIWHWNGQQLVAGIWTVHPIGLVPWFIVSSGHFGVSCKIADNPKVPSLPGRDHNGVSCVNFKHYVPQKADLWPGGRMKICHSGKQKGCGNIQCGCAVKAPEVHPGEQIVRGRFTCVVARPSLTCTVATGQGFTITASTVKRLPAKASLDVLRGDRLTASSRTSKEKH